MSNNSSRAVTSARFWVTDGTLEKYNSSDRDSTFVTGTIEWTSQNEVKTRIKGVTDNKHPLRRVIAKGDMMLAIMEKAGTKTGPHTVTVVVERDNHFKAETTQMWAVSEIVDENSAANQIDKIKSELWDILCNFINSAKELTRKERLRIQAAATAAELLLDDPEGINEVEETREDMEAQKSVCAGKVLLANLRDNNAAMLKQVEEMFSSTTLTSETEGGRTTVTAIATPNGDSADSSKGSKKPKGVTETVTT